MHSHHDRSAIHVRRHLGFTLTELMVAVVVLLVIILAVGRIFGTASAVVKAGEANADILQEVAAVEQLMRNDLNRISDEGFLLIQGVGVRNDVMASLGGGPLLDASFPADHIFRCDQIAFVADDLTISRQTQSMGYFEEQASFSDDAVVDYQGSANFRKTLPTPQSTASVVYYGHGLQLPFLPQNLGYLADADWSSVGGPAAPAAGQPWFRPTPGAQGRIELTEWPTGQNRPGLFNGSQPRAQNWTLARQETLLVDDYDSEPGHYLSKVYADDRNRNAAASFFDQAMESSRVDVLSNDLGRLRDAIRAAGPRGVADVVLNYRPRAEKRPPTLDKSDVLLTTSVLAGNCSNFVVDWTWSDGIGRELDLDLRLDPSENVSYAGAIRGVSHRGGVRLETGLEVSNAGEPGPIQEAGLRVPWFGFSDDNPNSGSPNVDVTYAASFLDGGIETLPAGATPFYDGQIRYYLPFHYHGDCDIFGNGPDAVDIGVGGGTLRPNPVGLIEGYGVNNDAPNAFPVDQPFGASVPVFRYFAFFGLNGDEPFVRDGEGRPITYQPAAGDTPWPIFRSDYTPWPSALRITATFHDTQAAIDGGRTVQFTIPLPDRVQDLPED